MKKSTGSLFDSPQFERPSDKLKLSEPKKKAEPKIEAPKEEVVKVSREKRVSNGNIPALSEEERLLHFPHGPKSFKELKVKPKIADKPQENNLKDEFKQEFLIGEGLDLKIQLLVWRGYKAKGLSALDARDVIDELIDVYKFEVI